MRHIVNFGLLFCFATLAISGVLAFVEPFSIVTTRVHIVFGLTTAILVGLHLWGRAAYFQKQLTAPGSAGLKRPLLLVIVAGWVALLAAAFYGWKPATLLVDQGYEAQHRAEIVRLSPLAGFLDADEDHRRLVARVPAEKADVALSLLIRFADDRPRPSIAVWAETQTGAMIETLYLDEDLAYSETPDWGDQPTPRNHILPIWRHKYTMVSGIDPSGKVDTLTAATSTHSFSLDKSLVLGEEKSFVLCVELNAPADPNTAYPDSHVGQPSLLYTAYVEIDSPQPYSLLELTGHGGGDAATSGAIQYDLEGFTTTKDLVDLLLVKVEPTKPAEPTPPAE